MDHYEYRMDIAYLTKMLGNYFRDVSKLSRASGVDSDKIDDIVHKAVIKPIKLKKAIHK